MSNILKPARVVKPGDILREELKERGWTQKDFADIIGRPIQAINEIIVGKKSITPETALLFSKAFGTSPEFWLNMESSYRLTQAQSQVENNDVTRKAALYGVAPIKEMVTHGWLELKSNVEEMEQQILSFFGVSTLDQMEMIGARFRLAPTRSPEYSSLITWLRKTEIDAAETHVKPYAKDYLGQAVKEIRTISRDNDVMAKVSACLADCGVKFVIVPHLKKTYVDGAAFCQSDTPVVAVSLRYNRVDNFWFTLMHELAHILLHTDNNTQSFIDENVGQQSIDLDEEQANQAARDWLIRPDEYAGFIKACNGRISKRDIESFADQLGIHPGIVVGRLQYENRIGYDKFRSYLGKITHTE